MSPPIPINGARFHFGRMSDFERNQRSYGLSFATAASLTTDGTQVGLRRFDQLLTEPQRNYEAIDACLQQLHRSGVLEHVRRYPLDTNDEQLSPATRTCLARNGSTLSALSQPACILENYAFARGAPVP
ncbi:hypothetical protein ACFFWD_00450 [Bradyrhizobium erythrophlei]|uniref:hypothetical protein n=1 Tax=Bradyrhizobium erythrophlei TaxID=1437360 RepID=UPI0035E76A69